MTKAHRIRPERKEVGGYIQILAPTHPLADKCGYVIEHRMVAYDAGILVDLTNIVHHKNGKQRDNRVENLEAMTQGEHVAHHNRERSLRRKSTVPSTVWSDFAPPGGCGFQRNPLGRKPR